MQARDASGQTPTDAARTEAVRFQLGAVQVTALTKKSLLEF
jgi:hypothetical protein